MTESAGAAPVRKDVGRFLEQEYGSYDLDNDDDFVVRRDGTITWVRVQALGDDVAMVMSYIGDSERDAEELANALIAHIRDDMDAGPAEESADGLLYRQGNIYSFIDRIGDGIYWIVSTDKTAGEDIRQQLGI